MAELTVTCPDCAGRGTNAALVNRGNAGCTLEEIACGTCNGRKVVGAGYEARRKAGREMRAARMARNESMRDAAFRLGMDVVEYSRMERGLEPQP